MDEEKKERVRASPFWRRFGHCQAARQEKYRSRGQFEGEGSAPGGDKKNVIDMYGAKRSLFCLLSLRYALLGSRRV